jgi:hypothetical protein
MLAYKKIKRVILETDNPTERKIRLLALLTSSLPKREKPVLTGGSAVEIYLDGVLTTGDVEIVYNVKELRKILNAWHFELGPSLRSYVNTELGLAVDAVGELSGSYDKLTTIATDYGPVVVIGIEDLILKRIASAKSLRVVTDMEQSYLLAKSQDGRIDWEYIEKRAKEEDVVDFLKKLRTSLKSKYSAGKSIKEKRVH